KGCGVSTTDVAADKARGCAEMAEGPSYVVDGEEAVFPVGDGFFGSQAVHVDGDVDGLIFESLREGGETLTPVLARHAGEMFLRGAGLAFGPGVDFESAGFEGAAIAEEAGGE